VIPTHTTISSIDFREFILALSFLHSDRVEDVAEVCFRCLDLNGDGHISRGELRSMFEFHQQLQKFTNLSSSQPDQTIEFDKVSVPINIISKAHGESDMLFERIDTNQDGVITYEELMAAMQSDPQIHEKIQGLLMKSEVSTLFKGSIRKVDFSS